MIDWKRKLTSRKFWAAVAAFVSMLMIALGKDAGTAQQVTALIMAGAAVVAYIIGEGLADSGGSTYTTNYNAPHVFDSVTEESDNGESDPVD